MNIKLSKMNSYSNKRSLPNGVVYIGSGYKMGWTKYHSVFANPYIVGRDGSKAKVQDMYRHWLWQQMKNPQSKVWLGMHQLAMQAMLGLEITLAENSSNVHGEVLVKALTWLASEYEKNGIGTPQQLIGAR